MGFRFFIRLLAAAGACVILGATATSAGTGSTFSPHYRVSAPVGRAFEFFTSVGDVQCEVSHSAPLGTYVYCQSVNRAQSVKLDAAGSWLTCRGQGCLGNPGLSTPLLRASTRVLDGPLTCDIDVRALSCYTVAGVGFTITANSVTSYLA